MQLAGCLQLWLTPNSDGCFCHQCSYIGTNPWCRCLAKAGPHSFGTIFPNTPSLRPVLLGWQRENPRNTSLSTNNKTELCWAILGSHKTEPQDDLGSGTWDTSACRLPWDGSHQEMGTRHTGGMRLIETATECGKGWELQGGQSLSMLLALGGNSVILIKPLVA